MAVIAQGSAQSPVDVYYVAPPNEAPNLFTAFWAGFHHTRSPWARAVFELRLKQLDPAGQDALIARALDSLDVAVKERRQAYSDALKAQVDTDKQQSEILKEVIRGKYGLARARETAAGTVQSAEIRAQATVTGKAQLTGKAKATYDTHAAEVQAAIASGDSRGAGDAVRRMAIAFQEQGVDSLSASAALGQMQSVMRAQGASDRVISAVTDEFTKVVPGGPIDIEELLPAARGRRGGAADPFPTFDVGAPAGSPPGSVVVSSARSTSEAGPARAGNSGEFPPQSREGSGDPTEGVVSYVEKFLERLEEGRKDRARRLGDIGDPLGGRPPLSERALDELLESPEGTVDLLMGTRRARDEGGRPTRRKLREGMAASRRVAPVPGVASPVTGRDLPPQDAAAATSEEYEAAHGKRKPEEDLDDLLDVTPKPAPKPAPPKPKEEPPAPKRRAKVVEPFLANDVDELLTPEDVDFDTTAALEALGLPTNLSDEDLESILAEERKSKRWPGSDASLFRSRRGGP